MKAKNLATVYAVAAAALYAINVPFSKLLLDHVQPTMMAAFLYLGAGLGMFLYSLASKAAGKAAPTEPLTQKELPYTIAMVVLDMIAPILLMFGIRSSNAPFLGVAFGMLILGERPAVQFYAALIVMVVSTYFMIKDTIELQHTHEHTHTHTHEHRHGDMVHTHEHTHTHTHIHVHGEDSSDHAHDHDNKSMPHEHLHLV